MHNSGQEYPVPSLSRGERSVVGAVTIMDDERDLERDSWWRTMSASLAMIKHAYRRLDAAERRLLEQEARILQLEQQVVVDELTGLLNRRGFTQALTKEMDRVTRGHSSGGLLIMIDLDNFKVINDTYGHAAGDAALQLVGRTLLSCTRTMDSCARLGGDEFVLLFANTARDGALVRAQDLIRQLNSLSLIWYGAELPIRASLGIKEYAAGQSPEDIFEAADDALYASKRGSRGLGGRSVGALA